MRPVLALLLAGCQPPVVRFDCAHGEPLCESRELAEGVDITAVYLYQAVEIPLMEGGALVEQDPDDDLTDPPVVAGRDAMVRVFLDPGELDAPRELEGKLTLFEGGSFSTGVEASVSLAGESDPTDLGTTLNFEVPGDAITPDTSWMVSVYDPALAPGEADRSLTAGAEWPDDGSSAALGAVDNGGLLRIFIIPIEYDGDGSGRLPDTSDEQIATFEQYFYKEYPVVRVEFEVGEPYAWNGTVDNYGGGWDTLLGTVSNLRDDYGVDDDVYIYGLFDPAESSAAYGGGVAGLSNMAMSASDAGSRASIGVGFPDWAPETMIHEVGHAHGRSHSPGCGAAGEDPSYPNDEGLIDWRGYDLFSGALKETDSYYDFMSYCSPYWVSGFTYEALATRIQQVDELYGQHARTPPPQTWVAVLLRSDGGAEWIGERTVRREPGPRTVPVTLLDEDGRELGEAKGWYAPFDHVPAGILSLPDPGPAVAGLRVAGRTAWRR